jgi:hypothetical protein
MVSADCPYKGFGSGVVLGEVSVDRGSLIGDRAEPAATDALPRHLREAILDGVAYSG